MIYDWSFAHAPAKSKIINRKPKRVLCVGDLVVDIVANSLARFPEPGEHALTDRIAVFPGGNALNTAVALNRLGERVTVAGSMGNDLLGRLLLDQMRTRGLDVRGVRQEPDIAGAVRKVLHL